MNIHNVNLLLVVPTRVDGWDSIDGVSNVGQYGMDLSLRYSMRVILTYFRSTLKH